MNTETAGHERRASSELVPQEDCLLANSCGFPWQGQKKLLCDNSVPSPIFPLSFPLPTDAQEISQSSVCDHFSLGDVERRTNVCF